MVLNEIALFANPEVFTRDPPGAGGGQRAVTQQGGSGLQVSRGRPSLRKRDDEVRVCERERVSEREREKERERESLATVDEGL